MGITTAPSTGAIMRSLPLHKAGVGSAVNDTTRELGGALGVAVMGSLVASQFRSSMEQRAAVGAGGVDPLVGRGAAVRGRHRWCQGGEIAAAARTSFVDAFSATLWVAVAVALVASALVAWLLRPTAMAKADAMVAAETSSEASAEATTG